MMRLAFHGDARYPDFDDAYNLYVSRSRSRKPMDKARYKKAVRMYCASLASRLESDGMIDLPYGIGSVCASVIRRKPVYRNGKFVGYGKRGKDGKYDGDPNAFGIVYMPSRRKSASLRCYGFVANKRLFRRMRDSYLSGHARWTPMEFNDEMI